MKLIIKTWYKYENDFKSSPSEVVPISRYRVRIEEGSNHDEFEGVLKKATRSEAEMGLAAIANGLMVFWRNKRKPDEIEIFTPSSKAIERINKQDLDNYTQQVLKWRELFNVKMSIKLWDKKF